MPDDNQSMTGKVCLITGATSGIGEVTGLALAQKGAMVVIAARNPVRAEASLAKIRHLTGTPSAEYLLADLSSMREVRRLASQFLERHERLDVLINNAGAEFFRRQQTPDGYEMTFAVNHLSYFLLTDLLIGCLKSTALSHGEARIVNVASGSNFDGKMHFDNLMFERGYPPGGYAAYAQSKLANVMFTFELARRLEGSGVTANALHPGFVATNLGKNNGLLGKIAMRIAHIFAINPQVGAQNTVYLASSPEVKGINGQFYIKYQPVKANLEAYDTQACARLWEISQELTHLNN
jgi:retinol dehydrogenase-12